LLPPRRQQVVAHARTSSRSTSLLRHILVIVLVVAACTPSTPSARQRTLYFRGDPIARIDESLQDRNVTRVVSFGSERITLTASLDENGRALSAHYSRPNLREVDLRTKNAVLIDLLHHVQPQVPLDVNLVDLSSDETIPGRVERRGAEVVALDRYGAIIARANVEGRRIGPGVFVEGNDPPSVGATPIVVDAPGQNVRGWRLLGIDDVLDAMNLNGPGQRREGNAVLFDAKFDEHPVDDDRNPSSLIESDDPRVIAFAKPHATGEPLVDAARLVELIHPLVDPRKRDIPPSAINMLTKGGDCDGAAALLTASLRAMGHAARPVVGYRHLDEKLTPHAWVEVHTPEGWLLVDPSVPRIGSAPTHLKLFNGLGSALTMGRVLGRLRVEPLP
jgi:transglutaminase-like putative cysteine protease